MGVNIEAVKFAIALPDFQQTALLEIALTHRSYTTEHPDLIGLSPQKQEREYRRLALLGDAILGAVVTNYLYHLFPDLEQGTLSPLKSDLVDRKKLSEFAWALNLRELCLLGGSALQIDKSDQNRFLSETFEALFGAIYLEFERNFDRAGNWVIKRFIAPAVSEISNLSERTQASPMLDYRRRGLLGNDILAAIVIDYLYHHFPELDQEQLTQWKTNLVKRKFFTKEFKALFGGIYLEFDRDFKRTSNWLVEQFIERAVNDLLAAKPEKEQELTGEKFVDFSDSRAFPLLVSHITQKDWQDKFLRVAELVKPADELLLLMKQQIDALAASDEKLQQLLQWIHQKSFSVQSSYKPAAVRAFYLALVRILYFEFVDAFSDPTRYRARARQFASNLAKGIAIFDSPEITTLNLSLGFYPGGVIACILTFDLEPDLAKALQELHEKLPHPDNEKEQFDEWRKAHGQAWVVKLTDLIGHNLQFSDKQKEVLKEYYYAHHLLTECLRSDHTEVTPAVRTEIENTLLLLPMI
jgi:dsRNA-specific ribonuclease